MLMITTGVMVLFVYVAANTVWLANYRGRIEILQRRADAKCARAVAP
jgi:hypothetical protein